MKFSRRVCAISFAVSALFSTPARADNWGCEVLLCMANPAGPMAVAACIAPITRLYQAIFKLRPDPFPTCSSAGPGNYVAPAQPNLYEDCPANTTPLSLDALGGVGTYVRATSKAPHLPGFELAGPVATGVGDGSTVQPGATRGQLPPKKTCVAARVGQTEVNGEFDFSINDYKKIPVDLYDRIVLLDPATSPNRLQVFVKGQLFRTVRP